MMSGGLSLSDARAERRRRPDSSKGWMLREGVGGWRGPCARQMADPSIHRDKPAIVLLKLATPVCQTNRRLCLQNHNTISCSTVSTTSFNSINGKKYKCNVAYANLVLI